MPSSRREDGRIKPARTPALRAVPDFVTGTGYSSVWRSGALLFDGAGLNSGG